MLTAERARELVRYEPATGNFYCLVDRLPYAKAGNIAQVDAGQGYKRVIIGRRHYRAHRLAWLLTHGVWPTKYIDHINGVRDDNRLVNLREANDVQNAHNVSKHIDGASPYKGVSFSKEKKKWRATICYLGRWTFLGYFKTPEAAKAAYDAEASKLFGIFAKKAS